MTEADPVVMKLRQRLLADRKRIEEELRTLIESESSESAGESMGELSMYDNHPADMATETFEREKNEALIKNAETILKRIDMALESMERSAFHPKGWKRCPMPLPVWPARREVSEKPDEVIL